MAGEVEPKLRGSHQPLWLDWLEGEYDNIRAALSWSLEGNHIEAGLRIAIAIYQFWTIRDYVAEGLAWLEQLLARENEAVSSSVHAKALVYAATTAGFRGNKTAQMAYGDKAAALAEKVGDEDKEALVWALSGQAYGARAAGDYQTEFALAQQVIQHFSKYNGLKRIVAVIGVEELNKQDRLIYGRAQRLLNFMTQPFHVSEVFTGKKGQYVDTADNLDGCERVLAGAYDKTKPSDFYMVGKAPALA